VEQVTIATLVRAHSRSPVPVSQKGTQPAKMGTANA
jgi:hypothetical protein